MPVNTTNISSVTAHCFIYSLYFIYLHFLLWKLSVYKDIKEADYFQNVPESYQFKPEYKSEYCTDEEWARMERRKLNWLVLKQIRTAQSG